MLTLPLAVCSPYGEGKCDQEILQKLLCVSENDLERLNLVLQLLAQSAKEELVWDKWLALKGLVFRTV